MDVNTLYAALLHDTLEDIEITKDGIASIFNAEIANLVNSITKINKMNFSTIQEKKLQV